MLAASLAGFLAGGTANAANILIVSGSDGLSTSAAAVLSNDLSGPNTVTITVDTPASLAGYTQIYDIRNINQPAFTVAEQNQYLAFLNAAPGNVVVLIGENSVFGIRNNPIGDFIALAGGGTGIVPATYSSNPQIVYPPFGNANLTNTVQFAACGIVTSPGTGQFASKESAGGCSVYWGRGTLQNAPTGALLVVWDLNFIYTAPTAGAQNEIAFRQQSETVAAAPTTPPAISQVSPASGSLAGGTSITITGTNLAGAATVMINGVPATNVLAVNPTTVTAVTPAGTAGTASVVVFTPNGANAPNTFYNYGSAPVPGAPTPLQISLSAPVTLQVVANESLTATGRALIDANQTAFAFKATTSTPWLTLSQLPYALPGVIQLSANATKMDVGAYTGSIDITAYDPNAGNPVKLSVPVTLNVLPPASITATPGALPSVNGYAVGSAVGYDVQIGPAGVAFTVQTSGNSDAWLTVSPKSGVAPAIVHVVIDPSKATYGAYFDAIQILSAGAPNSPLSVPVQMIRSSFIPQLPQQVNAASGAGPDHTIAPNEILTLFLTDFSCPSNPAVLVNGTPAPWASFAPGQINYSTPASLPNPSTVMVTCNGTTSWRFSGLQVASTIPGIFTSDATGRGQIAGRNADGSFNTGRNPTTRGAMISIPVTGFGQLGASTADGSRRLLGTVTAEIGGQAADVHYAGSDDGSPDGVQRIDLVVPPGITAGPSVPVKLWIDGVPAQTTATIAVQ